MRPRAISGSSSTRAAAASGCACATTAAARRTWRRQRPRRDARAADPAARQAARRAGPAGIRGVRVAAVKRVRVLLVEDQTLVREGLVSLLSFAKDLEVAGQAADGDEALEQIARLRPDVVLLDIRLPKRNGLEVLQEAGRRGPVPPTLILKTFDD